MGRSVLRLLFVLFTCNIVFTGFSSVYYTVSCYFITVTISEVYEKYAPQKPQHQSETNTISVREQHELLSKDLMNLSDNELIPSIQIGKKIIYTHKSVELQHEMNHLGQLQKQLLQRRPIMCRN